MDKKNFAFGKMNFILLAVSMVVVIIGFLLMSGGGSNENTYDPSIFDTRHIVIAPLVNFSFNLLMMRSTASSGLTS